jgi:hypothetical protein
VEPRAAYGFRAIGNFHLFGYKYIEAPNEPEAIAINYYVRDKQDGGANIAVSDIRGAQIAVLKGPSESGLNRVYWNMRPGSGQAGGGRGGFGAGSGQGGGRGGGAPLLPAGEYRISVEVGGQQQTVIGRIRERIW